MEPLSETPWDVVIAGTGLLQALLALSLSRSDKKVLHVDKNEYYGGQDAAFSLLEAEQWMKSTNAAGNDGTFSNVKINSMNPDAEASPVARLGPPRAYTLSLSPQLIYAQSGLLPALVSSRVHTQLEFQAVGSWWLHTSGRLQRIPSGREDVFADETLTMRDKRALMKFLRHVGQEPDVDADEAEAGAEAPAAAVNESLASLLSSHFKLSSTLHQPLLALSLSPFTAGSTESSLALSRIRRHLRSIGAFGAGFGAVIPKYGGSAEIAQVGCRASAVGGGVYVLGAGIKSARTSVENGNSAQDDRFQVELSNGETVRSNYVVGSLEDLPEMARPKPCCEPVSTMSAYSHKISIVSAHLSHLFPPTSESGPIPAGAVVLFNDSDGGGVDIPPVYLQAHSEDTGECPRGQCVIYGSTLITEASNEEASTSRVDSAVQQLIQTSAESTAAVELWSMTYVLKGYSIDHLQPPLVTCDPTGRIIAFPGRVEDIAFDDRLLASVKTVWEKIAGPVSDGGDDFMRFEDKAGGEAEDETM